MMTHKYGLTKIILALALILCTVNFAQAEPSKDKSKTSADQATDLNNEKTEYYSLVDPSIKPDNDEFYVKTIYKIKGVPRALIARSNNKRSGEMFNFPSEYGIGDRLSEDLIIKDIVIKGGRKFIRVRKLSNEQNYILKISYGKAKSRLILDSKSMKTKITHSSEGVLEPAKQ